MQLFKNTYKPQIGEICIIRKPTQEAKKNDIFEILFGRDRNIRLKQIFSVYYSIFEESSDFVIKIHVISCYIMLYHGILLKIRKYFEYASESFVTHSWIVQEVINKKKDIFLSVSLKHLDISRYFFLHIILFRIHHITYFMYFRFCFPKININQIRFSSRVLYGS